MNVEAGFVEIEDNVPDTAHSYRPAMAILIDISTHSARVEVLQAYINECTTRKVSLVPTEEMLDLHQGMRHSEEITFASEEYRRALLIAGIERRQILWEIEGEKLGNTEGKERLLRGEYELSLLYLRQKHFATWHSRPPEKRDEKWSVADFRSMTTRLLTVRLPADLDDANEILCELENQLEGRLNEIIPRGEVSTHAGWTIDRRRLPRGCKVKGFEFSPLTPTNFEIAELLENALPVGVQLNEIKLQYAEGDSFILREGDSDFAVLGGLAYIFGNTVTIFPPFSAYTVGSLGLEQARQMVTAELLGNINHELGHRFHLSAFISYPGLAKAFLSLLQADREQVGYDILNADNGVGGYDQPALEELAGVLEVFYLFEVIAELWRISFHPKLLAAVKKRFPNEYKMYRCMADEGYLSTFISENVSP